MTGPEKNTDSEAASALVPATPDTVQQLRDLVVTIKKGDASLTLGSKALGVLGRLVERPEVVAVNTITELAQWLDVNASTLSRLARSLGYSGFAEFQRVFRNEMTHSGSRFYSGQAVRLLHEHEPGAVTDNYLNAVIQLSRESVRNIEGCLAQLDAGELRKMATTIAKARQVRVFGVRQMYTVANLLAYGLGLIRPDVAILGSPGQGVAENLAHMHDGDVLVVSSVAPYSRSVAETAAVARKYGVAVIAITDYRASPLAANADLAFFVPHQSSFISNSIGAYIVFCESMINLVAKELGAKALRSLEHQEQLIADLRVEID